MTKNPIILIDDDVEDLDLLKEITSNLGFRDQVFAFHDPIAALHFLTNTIFAPAFIICDINMPKLDGFQLRKELLSEDSVVNNSPFFFVSTSRMDNEVVVAKDLKVTGYYQKSSTISGMKMIVQSIIDSLNK